jgi:hypothetical protein
MSQTIGSIYRLLFLTPLEKVELENGEDIITPLQKL